MDYTKHALVTDTDTVVKEGNTYTVDKEGKFEKNVVQEAISPPISSKNKIDTVNKTEKPQASNKIVDAHKRNKTVKFE